MFISFSDPPTSTAALDALSLHDALPIWRDRGGDVPAARAAAHHLQPARQTREREAPRPVAPRDRRAGAAARLHRVDRDRKSTRLNSSHRCISYAVFCLKKKKAALSNCNE